LDPQEVPEIPEDPENISGGENFRKSENLRNSTDFREIQKNSACVLANLTAEREEYRELVCRDYGNLIVVCFKVLKNCSLDIKKEIILFFTNLVVDRRFTTPLIEFEDGNLISEILQNLRSPDVGLLFLVLSVVEMVAREGGRGRDLVREDIDKLEELQYHGNPEIARISSGITDLI
jgi:hypothetical protein